MCFKITVKNGNYPLSYECDTAHEAYECIDELRAGLLHDVPINMDEIMVLIVGMKNDNRLMFSNHRYAINKVEKPQRASRS